MLAVSVCRQLDAASKKKGVRRLTDGRRCGSDQACASKAEDG